MNSYMRNLVLKLSRLLPQNVKNIYRSLREINSTSPQAVEKAEQIFYIKYLKEGMTIFDVGANIGELTLLFSRFCGVSGKVYAFEASSATFEKLSTLCSLTTRKNIETHHMALSNIDGTLELHVYPEEYASWNTLANRPLDSYGIEIKPVGRERVHASTIDTFCREKAITHIDLLKIDVEGAEYQVLLGAHNMLAEQRVRCCVFEFGATTFDMGNTPKMIEEYLAGLGYEIHNIVLGDESFPGREKATAARFSLHIASPK